MPIKLNLRKLLRDRDLTQTRFAELSGLSKNSVSTLVNQPGQIRIETIERICNTLNIDPQELFKYTHEEE